MTLVEPCPLAFAYLSSQQKHRHTQIAKKFHAVAAPSVASTAKTVNVSFLTILSDASSFSVTLRLVGFTQKRSNT